MPRLSRPLTVCMLLGAIVPAYPQVLPPHVRQRVPATPRQPPISRGGPSEPLTAEQQWAIASVRYPAVWPAPPVPPRTVLTVPQRPHYLPGEGEYWGPFLDDLGGWGFMVGPRPAPPAPPPMIWNEALFLRMGSRQLSLPVAPPPPPPLVLPVAGPISPDGQMVVRYPDGNAVTWQFPMVDYVGVFNGIGPGGGFRFILNTGRRPTFGVARDPRFTLNGQPVDPRRVPIGTRVTARALRHAPAMLTTLAFRQ
jgi:hypothetical protein